MGKKKYDVGSSKNLAGAYRHTWPDSKIGLILGRRGKVTGRKEGLKRRQRGRSNEVYWPDKGQSGFAAELLAGRDIGVSTVIQAEFPSHTLVRYGYAVIPAIDNPVLYT